MIRLKQGRQVLASSLVAIGLLGSVIPDKAAANPLMAPILRFAITGITFGLSLNSALTAADSDPSFQVEKPRRSLVLQIPPGSDAVCAEVLVIYLRDLNTGIAEKITEQVLTLSTHRSYVDVVINLPDIQQQGLVRFEAIIPALAHEIVIEDSQPVML